MNRNKIKSVIEIGFIVATILYFAFIYYTILTCAPNPDPLNGGVCIAK